MRYVSAYLLSTLGGNKNPKKEDLKKILSSVGIEADDQRLTKVITELNGKSIEEIIARGSEKLASVPSGGASVVSSGAVPTPAAEESPKKGSKKEEKKEESEEEDEDMGFGLFD